MNAPTFPFSVWQPQPGGGDTFDRPCHTLGEAKKHAAWLLSVGGPPTRPPYIIKRSTGEIIDYSDYEFSRGESRRIRK